ncbi:hypothetical protein EBV26_19275 [bacterium]|nr:hypothetical protein [bacterium]
MRCHVDKMVILIPTNANPTRADIDAFIRESSSSSSNHGITQLPNTIREIHSKSSAGALLHPAEEYFLEAASRLRNNDIIEY